MSRKVNVIEESWDYLIVLDACRHDYFRRFYGTYLCGKLEKVISPASCTLEWCKKSFRRYNDCVYMSANPFINSKVRVRGFNAKSRFFRVIDVWDLGWDEKLGTVHPREVNQAVLSCRNEYSDKKFIIHYIQPHAPYLTLAPDVRFSHPKVNRFQAFFIEGKNNRAVEKAVKVASLFARQLGVFGGNPSWRIRELLNLVPALPLDAVRRKAGNTGLRRAYTENLKIVLDYVADLVQVLFGIVILTSDHGELLGEEKSYGHFLGSTNPLLTEVPWFTVEGTKKDRKNAMRITSMD